MSDEQWVRYQFGRFILETGRDQLRQDGEMVPLQRKSFEVLQVLLANAGNLVRKEEIQQTVWPDRKIDDTNLSQHIYTLRRVLGDNPKSPSYILTIPGKGYVFHHPVVQLYQNPTDPSVIEESPESRSPTVLPEEALEDKETTIPSRDAHPDLSLDRKEEVLSKSPGSRSICWSALLRRAIVGLSLILVGSLGYHFFLRQFFLPAQRRQTPLVRQLTSLQGLENRPRFSPDGNLVAFSNSGRGLGVEHIYVKQVQQGDPIQLTFGAYRDQYPAWSPDGQQIAFLRHRPGYKKLQVIVIPTLGGPERPITEVWGGLDWSPNGRHLVVSDSSSPGDPASLWLLSVDGKERSQLMVVPSDSNSFDHLPRFSPDGRSIAFVRWFNDVASDLYVLSLSDRSVRQLTFDQRQIPSFVWSAEGKDILFISRRSGQASPWRISSSGGPPTVEESIPAGTFHFDIDYPSGRTAFTSVLSDSLVRVNSLEGKPWKRDRLSVLPVHCSLNSSKHDHTPRFSADGSKIAYISDQTGAEEVWRARADGSKPVQLTFFQEFGVGSPRWSPDGQWITFDRRATQQADIYVMREDGSGLQQLTFHSLADTMPSWSPDGEWIYFTSFRRGKNQIWKVPRTGGEPLQVTQGEANESLASADGQSLYFTNTNKKLLHLDLETGKEAPVPGLEEVEIGRYWDLTTNAIYFVSDRDKNLLRDDRQPVIYRFDLASRKISPITTIEGILPEWLPGLSVTPDERMIAVSYLTTIFGDIQLIEHR